MAPVVTTVDVLGQQLGSGPSILDPDNLITKLSGMLEPGRGKYLRSCVGSQCFVSGVK